MGSGSNYTHAKRKSSSSADHGDVMVELVKGKETAILLQNLLLKQQQQQQTEDHRHHHHISAQDLALRILASFTRTLSVLTTSTTTTKASRDRRGSYKRRRSGDSRVTISPVMGDSYAWRKYGQKIILNSQYPRCYFRCTNKYERGCKATKQVQVIQENPILYQTTYFNPHTCTSTTPATDDDNATVTTRTAVSGSDLHQDHERHTELDIIHNSASETSSLQDQWSAPDFTWPEYEAMASPYGEEGFHSIDMDVNVFADIENFHLDQIF